jgi:uncharacterized protein
VPKKQQKHKHIPQRTCIGCRETQSKRSLIRVVRSEQGVQVDPTGKLPGRGAYLHDRRSCWEKGMKGSLEKALKKELTPEDRERLIAFIGTLPEETSASSTDHEQM